MALLPVPKPLPSWWRPFCDYRYGFTETRPADAPKPAPKWCLQEWQRFDSWNSWKDSGGQPPKPGGLWVKTPDWAWWLREKILKARKGTAPPPPPPSESYTPAAPVLAKPGIYMYSADNTPLGAVEFSNKAADAGFKWIALLAHEGDKLPRPGINTPQWRDAIRDAGLKCVAWGGLFENAERCAEVAAQAVEPFDFYIPNPELTYKLETSQEAFERADRFCARFAQLSNKVGAVSTLVGADIHYRPFANIGFDIVHPQCYINEPQYAGLTPKYGIERAAGSVQHDWPGWRPEHVAPTVGSYGDYQKSMEWWKPYLEDGNCVHRWNYYTGEFMKNADFATVKAMLA